VVVGTARINITWRESKIPKICPILGGHGGVADRGEKKEKVERQKGVRGIQRSGVRAAGPSNAPGKLRGKKIGAEGGAGEGKLGKKLKKEFNAGADWGGAWSRITKKRFFTTKGLALKKKGWAKRREA